MFNIDRSGKAESLSCSTAPPANRGLKRFCSNTRRWDSLINCTVETIYVHIKEKSMKHKSVFIIFFNDASTSLTIIYATRINVTILRDMSGMTHDWHGRAKHVMLKLFARPFDPD